MQSVPARQVGHAGQAAAMPWYRTGGGRNAVPVMRGQSFDMQFRPDERDPGQSRDKTADGMRVWDGQRQPRNDPRFRPLDKERRQPEVNSGAWPGPSPGTGMPRSMGQPGLPYPAPGWRGY